MENSLITHIQKIKEQLYQLKSCENAINARRFFKTGKGDYAEHDQFLGISVPNLRLIARKNADIRLKSLQKILSSTYNEERLLALFILLHMYTKNQKEQKRIYDFYLDNLRYVNNWNLVDSSAHHLLGHYAYHNNQLGTIYALMHSSSLWEQRIAIIATWFYIKKNDYLPTYVVAEHLLTSKHDLLHKATGWMLREIGKKDETVLKDFLKKHAAIMPKTMLRYALERLSNDDMKLYQKFFK